MHLLHLLPAYMMPSTIIVVPEIPLTPSGKLDRGALDAVRQALAPEAIAPPRTAAEHALAALWREVLDVRQVGVLDDFFESGGDSLRAVRLFAAIERQFRCRLPLATLFRAPTIAQLAPLLPEPREGAAGTTEHLSVWNATVRFGRRLVVGVRHAAADTTGLVGHDYTNGNEGSVSLQK
jgi:acyl carrier protein